MQYCWTPKLRMLPAFLDKSNLGNVADLLERIRLGNLLAFLDELDLRMLPAFLDEPDLGILLDSELEMLQFPLFLLILT
ncbi:hypothetical protein RclHR1_04160014 [Rhizophagus clarus]|uniref:Uncharacterized protein n=1 Tax=Rhizophagus clarus TaxID=94130 RepID=A0A2Z6S9S8_9GLOM|nr:hypothetical protein RclHR1_04160014 [Rhizophagus clarus]